jgi:hypothetical protein
MRKEGRDHEESRAEKNEAEEAWHSKERHQMERGQRTLMMSAAH